MAIPQYNLLKIQSLQPSLQPLATRLIELAEQAGIPVRIAQGTRSISKQQELYESGTGVTKAPGGLSYHNYGLAFDIVPDAYVHLPNWHPTGPFWKRLGELGESVGLEWGGRWSTPDLPHFQIPSSAAPIRELQAYWNKFKSIMPVSITPTQGGFAMILLVLLGVYLFSRFSSKVV